MAPRHDHAIRTTVKRYVKEENRAGQGTDFGIQRALFGAKRRSSGPAALGSSPAPPKAFGAALLPFGPRPRQTRRLVTRHFDWLLGVLACWLGWLLLALLGCLVACLVACLLARSLACLLAACLLTCVHACLLAWWLGWLLACLRALLLAGLVGCCLLCLLA